jgi:hypothetical protein
MQIDKTEKEFKEFLTTALPDVICDYLKSQQIRFEYDNDLLAIEHQEFLKKEYFAFGCKECCLDENNQEYSHQEMRWMWNCLCGKHERLVDIRVCKKCGHEIPTIILCA